MSTFFHTINRTAHFDLPVLEQPPELLVVHAMAEYIEGTYALEFLIKKRLSAHALIRPDGTVDICALPSYKCAHAKQYNSKALGVEILVPGNHQYKTFVQTIARPWCTGLAMMSAVRLCRSWRALFPDIKMVRHSDIDEKKVDPGAGFPWDEFRDLVLNREHT